MLSAGLGPTEGSNMNPKISLSEVQTLIEQEVQKALADKDREVESVIQHLQDTYEETSFEMSIQRLENRINAVARRAEVALSYIAKNQKQSPPSSTDNTNILSESPEHDHVKATSENQKGPTYKTTSGSIIKMMQTARNTLQRFHADNEGLTTVLKDSDFERTPPVLTPMKPLKPRVKNEPWGLGPSNVDPHVKKAPPCLTPFDSSETPIQKPAITVKKEPKDFPEKDNDDRKLKHAEGPVAKISKKEESSPVDCSGPGLQKNEGGNQMKNGEDMFFYPPLPTMPFPSSLNMEAASYSLPQKVVVNLAFIRNPTRISVLWNIEDKDPLAPPMESYTILLTMETFKGSGVFLKWDTYDKLEAKDLPMCALINKYRRGHRLCAAVVGKDIFGRYGPYSKVATAILPD